MTESEAKEALSLLKSGKNYKAGHYHYGYIYYSYQNGQIKSTREDLSINIYEPTIYSELLSEDKFLETIQKYYSFEDFIKALS
ncbi:hypothetical protein JXR93_05685 [bacterium]|nr:hypothetical protein [bacterium]